MSSNDTFISEEERETFERELPDAYQVIFPAHCSLGRRLAILFVFGVLGLLWFGTATFFLSLHDSTTFMSFLLGSLSGIAIGFGIVYVCILAYVESFLKYEVLAIGQGSIVVLKKFMLFRRVRWAKFNVDDLYTIDFQNGLGAFRHSKLGVFAKNLPIHEIYEVRKAIVDTASDSPK